MPERMMEVDCFGELRWQPRGIAQKDQIPVEGQDGNS